MSSWPPPQHPVPPPGGAPGNPFAQPNNARAGCGRAVAITVGLSILAIAAIALLGNLDDSFTPILEDSVGVINIEGPITDSEDTVKMIRRFRENSMIKALVLRVDTPGGGVAASEEIYREVLKARTENEMPVIVSMGSVAASGGYYIAAASERIYATSGTITGSIGVIAPMFDARETLGKLGIRENSIVSGEHKGSGDPFSEQSIAERALMQGMVYDMYRQFFQVVLAARHEPINAAASAGEIDRVINPAQTKITSQSVEWAAFTTGTVATALKVPVEAETALRRLADGRVYTGEQALRVGLVDEIGTLQDAVDYAGEAVGLGDDPKTVERTPGSEQTSWLASSISQVIQQIAAPRRSVEFRAPY